MISQLQNRDQHKPVMDTEMKIRIRRGAGNFGVRKRLRASQGDFQ